MKRLRGIGVSSGLIMGGVYVFGKERIKPRKRKISRKELKKELAILKYAEEETRREMLSIISKIEKDFGERFSSIFNIHLALLDDPILIPYARKKIEEEGINASYAFWEVIEKIIENFSFHSGQMGRMMEVLHDISSKMLHYLGEREQIRLEDIEGKVIIVGKNFTPQDTLQIPKEKIAGIVCSMGTQTSHAAILARALRIPAILGIPDIENILSSTDIIILDGRTGKIIINPTKKERELYARRKKEEELEVYHKEGLTRLPAKTKDGHRVNLVANIEIPEEAYLIKKENADGIGLFRTEFLFIERIDLPDENEQTKVYLDVAEAAHPHPVTIRTLDIGEGKLVSFLKTEEVESSFGMRAIRLCLKYKEVFKTQLRAILRASVKGNIKVMFPMITSIDELKEAISILSLTKDELKKKGIPFDRDLEVGTMIETPASVFIADILAEMVDFFSIGTNDLIQYTLVVDRINPKTAYLYEPLHPSILRSIKNVVEAAHKKGIWVSMCGEMASEPLYTPFLLGLGIDELSVNWDAVSSVRNVIRKITMEKASKIRDKVLSLNSPKEIRSFLKLQMKTIY
ncbi:TPA: phosphoenolpyruvate--protein phosphotransferase [bacterium]|nr:phosphoenolpyruvate--protein phosphotransferase [bacterium]